MPSQNIERSKLLVCCKKNPHATLNLFCFPFSGAGPAVFRRWVASLPATVEVWAVQLQGREARHAEPMTARLYQIVEEAAEQIAAVIREGSEAPRPFILYGHSLGAYLAYCVALKLKMSMPGSMQPKALFLSGRRSPEHECAESLAQLADGALAERLTKMGGISPEFAAEPEFLRVALPKLRYDLSINETSLPPELKDADPKIDARFWIYRGTEDCQAPEPEVLTWQHFSAQKCTFSTVPGNHFFITNNAGSFMSKFVSDLKSIFQN